MEERQYLIFGPFRLDLTRDRLWKEGEAVELRAKPSAVLRYLLEHPGQVVTRSELLKYVWAGIYVTKTALRVCLREIRLALGDEATAPQYIETVGRQGYRFIGQVKELEARDQLSVVSHQGLVPAPRHEAPHFVGREQELAQLRWWFEPVLAGHPQLVFVTGEPGIGKTTLVNTFLHRAQETGQLWIAHGQCVEQYGIGAPYLPLLGALGRLCQEPGAKQLVRVFEQHAPAWLSQLLTLLSQEQRKAFSANLEGVSHERMLRELADVLAIMSTERPVVLVLEDLHWSDSATVETLAYLARRREAARLFVLGTYRPADIVVGEHPLRRLRQELLAHELCEELRVELLSEEEVKEYVTQRLARNPLAAELSPLIYRRTEGNALFVVNVVDYLLRQGLIQKRGDQRLTPEAVAAIQTELPEGLQHLILKEVEGLRPEEQHVLEAASVAGLYFTAAEIAVAENSEEERIEAVCDGLVRQQRLIEAHGTEEWPAGTMTAGYRFQHAVYQQIVCSRVGQARQVRLHRLIGERLEAGYGARAAEVAAHLAVHFEQGRDSRRAVQYRRQAAERALRQHAYQEVHLHGTAGLSLLKTLPDTPERKHLELKLRQLVSAALYTTQGFMDDELKENLQRARQLCQELEDETTLVSMLIGLGRLYQVQANDAAMAELEQEVERLAERVQEAQLRVQLHAQLVAIATQRGQHVRAAEHYQHVLRHHDPQALSVLLASFGGDPFVSASSWSGMSLSLAGQPEQGWSRVAQALMHAEELSQPLALVNGLYCAALVKLLRGEYDEARRLADKLDALTQEYHIPLYRIAGVLLRGGLAVRRGAWEEGIAEMTAGLSQYRDLGAQSAVPFFLSFLAEGYRQQRKVEEALRVVSEALSLTATNFDVFWEAELYRLKGELMLQKFQVPGSEFQGQKGSTFKVQRSKSKLTSTQPPTPNPQAEAEACFRQAVEIARRQGAKLLELRAVMSLSRLWHQHGKQKAARHMLAEIYHWFTEGFDTEDLQAARTLLAEWSASSQGAARPTKQKW
jgi:predicted ATPase/DNA-binding winged helix-turn-helix (wHTH) protein